MNRYVFAMPWITLGEKQLIFQVFQVWEVANHWNDRVKRFMKKLGSLPSRTDEISLLYVSPKSNCLTKMAQNSRLWCQRELWIETLQRFFVAEAFNTTHCHIVRCQHRETRFWEFPTFQSSLAKGRWWGSPKRPLVWELALFGIPTKINHSLGFGGCLFLSSIYLLTSIVLTNLRLMASQPLGYESCPDTSQRYLYMKKLFKTKRAPSRWWHWEARMVQLYQWYPMMACIPTKWQYCLHMCRSYEVFLRKLENNCIEWLSAWSFSTSTKSSGTPHMRKE